MKDYLILKDFKGSQDGFGDGENFDAGTVAALSTDLARIAVGEGWARPAEEAAKEIASAPKHLADNVIEAIANVTGLDGPVPEGDLEHDIVNPAELRETKVIGPEKTKPDKPAAKKGKQ
jgi:hypothetical protein